MLRGLFEGAQYNSEAGAKCAVYSRARSNQGNTVCLKNDKSSKTFPTTKVEPLESGLVHKIVA